LVVLLLLTVAGALAFGAVGAFSGYLLGMVVSAWLPAARCEEGAEAPHEGEPPAA
jgi:hypothetical protein